ncbi:MAG: hypothetical protein EON58_08525 [Alphaproteobacteria bacterium]|nr:MAG: hypothetical protein EON58_08525 [Alphaproteobacteria bacterium]
MRYMLVTLGLMLTPLACAAGIRASELSIGGVGSGATEASVVKRLGSPAKRLETGDGIELHYSDLVVTIGWIDPEAPGRQRRVVAIYGTGSKACTPKGLCPGMPSSEAARLYGHVEPTLRETGTFLEYQPAGANCWLKVSAPSGVVQSLAVAYQP